MAATAAALMAPISSQAASSVFRLGVLTAVVIAAGCCCIHACCCGVAAAGLSPTVVVKLGPVGVGRSTAQLRHILEPVGPPGPHKPSRTSCSGNSAVVPAGHNVARFGISLRGWAAWACRCPKNRRLLRSMCSGCSFESTDEFCQDTPQVLPCLGSAGPVSLRRAPRRRRLPQQQFWVWGIEARVLCDAAQEQRAVVQRPRMHLCNWKALAKYLLLCRRDEEILRLCATLL
mmetsp:Transcript_25531/g.45295  ORF Transcript_25531/g.45295 Transcript_25531/m.45295 type:complete len:231 (+) Transcript_25531:92-784(+)